jgi:hypothetical protein
MRNIRIALLLCLFGSSSTLALADDEPNQGAIETIDLTSTRRVTVHLKSAMPDAAVDAIARQCGAATGGTEMRFIKFGPTTGPWSAQLGAHDFDVDNEPLVKALVRLSEVYDLFQDKQWGEDQIVFSPRRVRNETAQTTQPAKPAALPPMCFSGPFAVIARAITRDRQLDPLPNPTVPGASPVTSNTSISYNLLLQVLAEPRIAVLQWASQPAIQTMVDDQNQVLWNAQQFQIPISFADDNPRPNVPVLFLSPDSHATRIAKFSGVFQLKVVKRIRRYEWTHLDDGRPRSAIIEGVHVALDAFEDSAGTPTQQAVINIDRNGIDPGDWQARMTLIAHGSHLRIYDQSGDVLSDPFRWYPITTGLNLQMMVKVAGHGDAAKTIGRAYKLIWDFPVEEGDISVPFSFKDLPLPPP